MAARLLVGDDGREAETADLDGGARFGARMQVKKLQAEKVPWGGGDRCCCLKKENTEEDSERNTGRKTERDGGHAGGDEGTDGEVLGGRTDGSGRS